MHQKADLRLNVTEEDQNNKIKDQIPYSRTNFDEKILGQ